MSSQKSFFYEQIHQSKRSRARVGRIHTPHGIIDTPNFVAVGTNGTLKAIDSHMIKDIGLQLMFCNTYHLMLQPGADTVATLGGLHTFIKSPIPLITDSGGFQVFSLAYGSVKDELKSRGKKQQNNSVASISEEGVTFRSYRDGKKITLTPESSVAAQKQLGANIIVPFDELPPYHVSPHYLKKSLARTHRWEARSLAAHKANPKNQAMYAVIHGGVDYTLRAESCNFLGKMPFDGYAIGGSIGKTQQEMFDLLSFTVPRIPDDKPRHLLGIGDPPAIAFGVQLGIDTFDSAHPTKCARHGLLFTPEGAIKIRHASNQFSTDPIDKLCRCTTCQRYSRAYLHHLFKAREPIYDHLASIHNLTYMVDLMASYRMRILHDEI